MTNKYVSSGGERVINPGQTYVSGRIYFLGALAAIAMGDYVAADSQAVFRTQGVFNVALNDDDTAVNGEPAYWDADNAELVDDPAGVHPQVGWFAEDSTGTSVKLELGQRFSGTPAPEVVSIDDTDTPYTLVPHQTDVHLIVDTQGGAVTVNLPTAASMPGRRISAVRAGTGVNAITLDQAGAETINGSASAVATLDAQHDTLTLQSDGVSNWTIVSSIIA